MLATATFDLTGWSTVGLAVVTVLSVVLGYRALRQTQAEIALSRKEVEEAHRPVLVPLHDARMLPSTAISSNGSLLASPQEANGALHAPIANIGTGPALNVRLSVNPTSDDGTPSPAWGESQHDGSTAGFGVDDARFVIIRVESFGGLVSFRFQLVYAEVAGQDWETVGEFRRVQGQAPGYGPLEFRKVSGGATAAIDSAVTSVLP